MLVLAGVSHRAWAASTFKDCADLVAAQSQAYESYRCYYEVASSSGEWQAAGSHLKALATSHPEIDWIVFVRALVSWPLDKDAGERLYLEAAQRFKAAGNIRGEVLARANLSTVFYQSGRVASAAREVERVTSLAEHAQEPELRIRARVVEAQFFIDTGTNLGRAQRALRQAEAEIDLAPTYWLRNHVLHSLGSVLLLLGQYDDAVIHFRRLHEEASVQQDLSTVARARLDVVNALLEKRSVEPHAVDVVQLAADAEAALVAATRANDLDLELSALRLLGEVFMTEHAERARGYIDACVQRAKAHKRSQALSHCLWIRGRLLADTDPIAAQRAIDMAIDLLHHEEGTDYALLAYAWRNAMRIAWQTQSREAAIMTGKQALTAIERLRDMQPGLQSRAVAFSAWTQDYYWLSGQILRLATAPALLADRSGKDRARSLVDEAFQIGERMRARSLLDQLKVQPRSPADLDDATLQRRQALLKSIVDVNRQLLKSKSNNSAELLRELEALERQEVDAREAQHHPHVAMRPVSLTEVQKTLAANEALLSFQIGLKDGSTDRFAGGSWLFAITREQIRVFELPDRYSLSQSLALFQGLMNQPPPQRTRAGFALYNQLLRDALKAMPEGIERLIVVPDSPLDTFPLSALSSSLTFEPLGKHYEFVLVPSATIWRDWRGRAATADPRPALVLADPQLEFATGVASPWRSGSEDAGLSLGRLPHARAEGLEIVEQLRGRGTLWTGVEASEAALKASDLSRYSVLHFATHTIVDSVNTDRSAIVLASGSSQQDGLLQSREIADLRLDGHVVVLSSCQSATGTLVQGEGVLGLARSFFAAGARVVIGSLWPVRDDHAKAFFEPFYAALGDGRTVGAAFHQAQRRLIDKGLPMEVWAGFVLMGDPDATLASSINNTHGNLSIALRVAAAIGALIFAVVSARILYSRRYRSLDRRHIRSSE